MQETSKPRAVNELALSPKPAQGTSKEIFFGSTKNNAMTSSASSELRFVTISHPNELRQRKDVRTDIRRHVMKKIGQQRRRPKPRAKGRPSATPSTSSHASTNQADEHGGLQSISIDRTTTLNSPQITLPVLWDFPVGANDRAVELIRFLNEQNSVYLPFRSIWFDIALTDKGAFHVTLGNAADLLLRVKGGPNPDRNLEMLQYYSLSVAHLRERLSSAVDSTSDGMVAHILSHLCLCMRRQDWTAWKAHMGGLVVISRLRNGLAHLGRGVHTWILLSDLGGSIVQDTVPQLPLPPYLSHHRTSLEKLPTQLQELVSRLKSNSIAMTQTIQALQNLCFVANEVNANDHSPLFWQQDQDGMDLLGPCIHFLLSMPRLSEDLYASPRFDDLAMELVRLVGLCVMSRVKAIFSFSTPEQAQLESKLSRFTISYAKHINGPYRDLKIWALVTASLLHSGESRDVYLDELRQELAPRSETDAVAGVKIAKDFIWFEVLSRNTGAETLTRDIAAHSDEPAR